MEAHPLSVRSGAGRTLFPLRGRRALTLLESLVALAILGGMLAIFASLLPQALGLQADSQDLQALDGAVQELIQKVEGGRIGEGEGQFGPPLEDWHYRVRLHPVAASDQEALWKIEVRVVKEAGGREIHFTKLFQKTEGTDPS